MYGQPPMPSTGAVAGSAWERKLRIALHDRINTSVREHYPPAPTFGVVTEWLRGWIADLYWKMRYMQYVITFDVDVDDVEDQERIMAFERQKPVSLNKLVDKSGFDRNWLKYFYAVFKQECPSAAMNLDDFTRLMGTYFPHAVSDDYAERLFLFFDRDGNDQVSFEELVMRLSQLRTTDTLIRAQLFYTLVSKERMCDEEGERVPAAPPIIFSALADYVACVCELAGYQVLQADEVHECAMQADLPHIRAELRKTLHKMLMSSVSDPLAHAAIEFAGGKALTIDMVDKKARAVWERLMSGRRERRIVDRPPDALLFADIQEYFAMNANETPMRTRRNSRIVLGGGGLGGDYARRKSLADIVSMPSLDIDNTLESSEQTSAILAPLIDLDEMIHM